MKTDLKNLNGNYSLEQWCNLIAWLMNCDELFFITPPKKRTAEDILNSNSNGELMFLFNAIEWIGRVIQAKFPENWQEKFEKCLNGENIEPEVEFATGFGLKCQAILWKTDEAFETKVDQILEETWGGK